ncbi:MAG: tetratricopeptide repeat protein [Planctomycetota bacterium]
MRPTLPSRPDPPTSLPARPWWRTWAPAIAVLLAAGLFAWWGTWGFGFKFDDGPAIVANDALLAGDWWTAAFGGKHQPLANRPFTCWSLALDFAIWGPGPFGPHFGNVVLHLCNGVLLLLLANAALRAPNLAGHFPPVQARRLALAIATVWLVHPLATDAVAYATQRSTLLASACLLLSLLATARAAAARSPWPWRTAAVLAQALGMASKEEMVVGPLLVVLFERAFLWPSWRALRQRRAFVLALAATWGVLAACVAAGPHNPTVGYATHLGTTAWQWLLTQAGVVAHYVALAAWPSPLRGAYDWGVVKDVGPAVLPGLLVLALLAVTVACWRKHAQWGWLGALFFLWLAPTSTVLPIVTEVVAERRAYLPMLAVIVPAVFAGRAFVSLLSPAAARVLGAGLAAAAVVGLALMTRSHAASYASEPEFWQDAYDKRDPASRTMLAAQILSNHGAMLFGAGRVDEAAALFDLAMQCEAPTHVERTHHAASLQQRGRHREAVAALEQAIREAPTYAEGHGTLGTCLLMEVVKAPVVAGDPRLARAVAGLQRAVELEPRRVAFWNTLGKALEHQQRWPEAEAAYRRAVALPYERIEPFVNLADVLVRLGRANDATALWSALLAARPADVALRLELARAAFARNDRAGAAVMLREVVRLEPGNAAAAQALRELAAKPGR